MSTAVDRIKAAKEVIGACVAICGLAMVGTRYLVRQAVRAELAEMRQLAEDARVQASGVKVIRDDLNAHARDQAKDLGTLEGKILTLGGADMALKTRVDGLQERIDEFLSRSKPR